MSAARRPRGTGSLTVHADSTGRRMWKARVHVGGGAYKKLTLGPVRAPGSRVGLTRTEAEAQLRRHIEALTLAPAVAEAVTVEDAGQRLVERLEALGRKRSHLEAVRSHLRQHIGPFFDGCTLESVERRDVEAFMAAKRREGKAPKSILNYVGTLHSILAFGQDRGWCRSNPAKLAEKPKPPEAAEIRFLDEPELEALLRAVPDDVLGAVERPLYLAAAMTGARQGELLGLRWGDVDWTASKVRIRRAWVRGEMGTPKSRRGSRAVPLAQRLAVELERHYQASRYQSDSDLVFGHPLLGVPLDRSKVLKRFKATLRAGGVRAVRFHDLRHTFGTRMAAAGVPMRTLQEWMGHRDFKTTLIYADYMPGQHEAELVDAAFGQGSIEGSKLSEPEVRSDT